MVFVRTPVEQVRELEPMAEEDRIGLPEFFRRAAALMFSLRRTLSRERWAMITGVLTPEHGSKDLGVVLAELVEEGLRARARVRHLPGRSH